MTAFIRTLYDTREEVIFWVLLTLTIAAVAFERATFLEASGFVLTAYGMLLAKKAHDKKHGAIDGPQ